jgi:hypothetical protein
MGQGQPNLSSSRIVSNNFNRTTVSVIQCPVSVLATLLNKVEKSWPGYICQQAWPTTQVSGFFFSILWYWKFDDFSFQKTTEMSQIYTKKTHLKKQNLNCLWPKKNLLKKYHSATVNQHSTGHDPLHAQCPLRLPLWMNLNWVNIWFHLGNPSCMYR